MDKQVILRIISAVVGLGLVGAGVYLIAAEGSHGEALLMAGIAIAGGAGTVGLPAAFGPGAPRSEKRRSSGPPVPPLTVLALALAMTLPACGAGALAIQADSAAASGHVWTEFDTTLLRIRAAELDGILDEARAECGDSGCDDERAAYYRARLTDAEQAWAPALACRAPVPEALRGWVDAIELAHTAATAELGLEHATSSAARFVLVYQTTARCIEAARPGTDVPTLPSTVETLATGAAQ